MQLKVCMVKKMFGKRLKIIRNELKISQIEMAKALNISIKGYWNYENDEREPKLEILKRIVEKFNINPHWLLTGDGEIFFKNEESLNNTYFYKEKFTNIEDAYRNFGKRLTIIQDNNQYSDSKMAEILNISHCAYINIKLCKKEPNIKIINKLKKIFDVDINWLLYGEKWYDINEKNNLQCPELTSNEIMILKKIFMKTFL